MLFVTADKNLFSVNEVTLFPKIAFLLGIHGIS